MNTQELIEKTITVIGEKIRPATLPIAVKMLTSADELPAKVKIPTKMGHRWALCQALFAARSLGWMMALGAEDQACQVAQSLLGFNEIVPFYSEGNLCCGMYTETLQAGAKSEAAMPRFKFGDYKYVLVGPLKKFGTLTPDIVWIYGTPGQITRLIHAALYKSGGNITSSFTGRAGCVGTIAGTMQKNSCQVVVNGNGESVFGHAQDCEMSFSIPWDSLEDVLDGLEGTHNGGVRYPYPAFNNFTPQFPPKYYDLEKIWSSKTDK